MTTHFVIMAGGQGTRLYPLSTAEKPKQFLDLLGVGRTLIQLTCERFRAVDPHALIWIVTSSSYVHWIKEQLPDIPAEQIIAEPEPRNTAPCISYAVWKIKAKYGPCNIVVSPSDAYVLSIDSFKVTIKKALDFTARKTPSIVCVGIKPTEPNTGYGYIEISSIDKAKIADKQEVIVKVSRFKEKPDIDTAKSYLKSGNFFWNAGIFIWNSETIEKEIRCNAPGIAQIMDSVAPSFYTENERLQMEKNFSKCEKISIDYAVMEKSSHVWCLPASWIWDDLGSFAAIEKVTGRKISDEIKMAQEEYQKNKRGH